MAMVREQDVFFVVGPALDFVLDRHAAGRRPSPQRVSPPLAGLRRVRGSRCCRSSWPTSA